ncbi:MAG TPA: gephyrin-like molybdotransferase Glp, partial [Nitrososphaeraceae archaeon]|nr:gephyrin-like molybdotransferase Glp [Nitrososphaeraceae archaeon]
NRVLSMNLSSRIAVPSFTKAERDGYAIKSNDIKGASMKQPILLDVIGRITAGQNTRYMVESGKAVAIATGARIPKGADSVVMVENTEQENNTLKIFNEIGQGKNIAMKGEDIKNRQSLYKKGTWLTSQDVGLIASVGINKVPVFKKPKVAIFATGDELVEPGSKLHDTSIFESNRYMISGMIRDSGGEVVDLGICKDNRDLIFSKLKEALKFDFVAVSGGASVGEKDYVPDLVNSLGKPGLIVHGIAMKPGSPTALGVVYNKPIVISPGFPVSSFVAFYTFGRPLILKMLATDGPITAKLIARMASNIHTFKDFRTFVRVQVVRHNGSYLAKPVSAAGASLLSTLTMSNGMIIVDNDSSKLVKDKRVEVIPLRNIVGYFDDIYR